MKTDSMCMVEPAKVMFTYALEGGMWLEWRDGQREWISFDRLHDLYGAMWVNRNLKAANTWNAGQWIEPIRAADDHHLAKAL